MRTIPTAISTGFTNSYRPFWLVKIEATGGIIYYWTTLRKNRQGNVMTLKETSGGASLTYDSGMIADEVDGERMDGIGPMESGADIYLGGGVGTVSDLEIDILNQARFDQDVIAAGINIEMRPITIYLGFLPDGAAPTVVIQDDMLKRWAGMLEDVDFGYGDLKLRCVDGSLKRNITIPLGVVEANTYPYAPKESIGKAIPIVYGAFYADEETERDFEQISPVPTIKINDLTQKFLIAGHASHTVGGKYTFSSENNIFGRLQSPDNSTNTTNETSFDYIGGGNIIATFRQIPRMPSAKNSAVNPENAFDDSQTTYVTVGYPSHSLWEMLNRPADIGKLVDSAGASAKFTMRVYLGAITDFEADKIGLAYENGAHYDLYMFLIGDANSIKAVDSGAGITWEILGDYHFAVVDYGATSMTLEVKHMVIEYHVLLYSLTRSLAARPGAIIGLEARRGRR